MASRIQSDFFVKETAILNWSIRGYELMIGLNGFEHSKYFSSSYSDCKFQMHLNIKSIFKFYLSCNKNDVQIQCRISFIDDWNKKQHTKEYRLICNEGDYNFTESVDYIKWIDWDSIKKDLRIYCEVDVLERKEDFPSQTKNVLVEKDFLDGMQALLENGDFSDVILVVGGKDFKAHKAILSARSDVFKTMFVTDLEEKKRNRVSITDIEVEVFEHLLLYIYTDNIPELNSEHTVDLFIAADKYNLKQLKSTCEQLLIDKPEIDSAANVLMIADMHNSAPLKEKYIQFITDNSANVMKTEGWKHLVKARPDLMMELYQDISEKFGKLNVKS